MTGRKLLSASGLHAATGRRSRRRGRRLLLLPLLPLLRSPQPRVSVRLRARARPSQTGAAKQDVGHDRSEENQERST